MTERPPPTRPVGGPPYEVQEDDPRLPKLAAEVAQRLKPLCEGMPDAEFAALTRAVALRRLRWG